MRAQETRTTMRVSMQFFAAVVYYYYSSSILLANIEYILANSMIGTVIEKKKLLERVVVGSIEEEIHSFDEKQRYSFERIFCVTCFNYYCYE